MRTALIAVALAGVAGALAFADIYNVPPQPIRLHLTSGTPVVAVSSSVDRRFPAQRAFIQLAVVGTPVLRTPPPVAQDTHGALLVKPGVEDPTPVPLRALSAVTVNDMQLARRILLRAGIPAASLHVRSPGVADAGRGIGQILVAVEPLTDATYNALATKISGLIASYPEIEAGGLIVERPSCDAESKTASAAVDNAKKTAAALARAAGLSVNQLLQNSVWYSDSYSANYQPVCGTRRVQLPASQPDPPANAGVPAYTTSSNLALAFSAKAANGAAAAPVAFASMWRTASTEDLLTAHQLIVPDNEPFVSAIGRADGSVRPDALLFVVSPADDAIRAALRRSVAPAEMLRHGSALDVRVRSESTLVSLQRSVAPFRTDPNRPVAVDIIPFVADCSSVRTALAAQAVQQARKRARIMATAAHARLGTIIAVNDAGQIDGAICGFGAKDSLETLVQAAAQRSPQRSRGFGIFESAVAVAWRLNVPAAARGDVWPQLPSPLQQPFLTKGDGVIGRASAGVEPTAAFITLPDHAAATRLLQSVVRRVQLEPLSDGPHRVAQMRRADPAFVRVALARLRASDITVPYLRLFSSRCEEREETALQAATRDAITAIGSHPLQALIDQGAAYEPSGICGGSQDTSAMYVGGSYTGYVSGPYAVAQRVLAIMGR